MNELLDILVCGQCTTSKQIEVPSRGAYPPAGVTAPAPIRREQQFLYHVPLSFKSSSQSDYTTSTTQALPYSSQTATTSNDLLRHVPNEPSNLSPFCRTSSSYTYFAPVSVNQGQLQETRSYSTWSLGIYGLRGVHVFGTQDNKAIGDVQSQPATKGPRSFATTSQEAAIPEYFPQAYLGNNGLESVQTGTRSRFEWMKQRGTKAEEREAPMPSADGNFTIATGNASPTQLFEAAPEMKAQTTQVHGNSIPPVRRQVQTTELPKETAVDMSVQTDEVVGPKADTVPGLSGCCTGQNGLHQETPGPTRTSSGNYEQDGMMEVESCVILPCCRSKVPRAKAIRRIAESEECPCCLSPGIKSSMLLTVGKDERSDDNNAVVMPCCSSHIPREHAERMVSSSSQCTVCLQRNVRAEDLQSLNPMEISSSQLTTSMKFAVRGVTKAQKTCKLRPKGGLDNRTVYEDVQVGPGVKVFSELEIETMTAAQRKAACASREAMEIEEGWDQMSLNFVSQLLMQEAHGTQHQDSTPSEEVTSDVNPLVGFLRSTCDPGQWPARKEAEFTPGFNASEPNTTAKPAEQTQKPQITSAVIDRDLALLGQESVSGSGGSGDTAVDNKAVEEEEGWMELSLGAVSALLNAEAKRKRDTEHDSDASQIQGGESQVGAESSEASAIPEAWRPLAMGTDSDGP